ncbi:hypothetical protein HMPREF2097_00629 [Enterococcus faecalis 918]|nr:hypothetical protein [Enterococcus faecalis]KDE18341.1 hypothetical protein HMPREF2097_00629 [Enterococcus faecalis 918]
MTERSRKKEALEVKLELNNRSAVIISTVFILLNTAVWIKFFFFYNPYHGAFDLLWTLPIGLIGAIPSMYVKSVGLRIYFIVMNILLAFSFLLPWILLALLGA